LGYLRKIGDKKFRIMYDVVSVDGKRRQKTETLVGLTKQQAEAILAKRKAAVVAGEYLPSGDMTMNDLFDRFMQAKQGRLAATTVQRYECLLRLYLRPAVGAKRVGRASCRPAEPKRRFSRSLSRSFDHSTKRSV
jgi:hypothetical protein